MVTQTPIREKAADVHARALARARAENTQALWSYGAWYASSTSRPNHWHRVGLVSCECEASAHARYCKHLAAVADAQRQPCEHCGTRGDVVREWIRIHEGRHEYQTHCRDRAQCWARWEAQQGKGA